MMTVKKN